MEKLTSDRLVPQAAERADPDTGGPKAPSAVEGCGTRRAAAALPRDQDGVPQVPAGGNADMGPAEVRAHCQVDDAGKSLLRVATQAHRGGLADERAGVRRLGAFARTLKLARTIGILHCVQDRPGRECIYLPIVTRDYVQP